MIRRAIEKDLIPNKLFLFNTNYKDYEKWNGKIVKFIGEVDFTSQRKLYKAVTLDGKYEMEVFVEELIMFD